jgi:HAE1 family hydrophobic/amphiphilic exporter-1
MVSIWWYRFLQLFFLFIIKYYAKGFRGEDTGAIILRRILASWNSLENTENYLKIRLKIFLKLRILRISGRSLISGTGSNYGMVIVKSWAEKRCDKKYQ